MSNKQNSSCGEEQNNYPLQFAGIFPEDTLKAQFKLEPEDFHVSEELGFEPSGEGEHLLLYCKKSNLTTEALVSDIARHLNMPKRDIGYCGLKDKFAVTEQWLSVNWPVKEPVPQLAGSSWQVLQDVRHNKKLKRGIHKSNHFIIRLKNIVGDLGLLENKLENISSEGFPNYFGEQRFGNEGSNIYKAEKLFGKEFKCKPFLRSIYYSAARSFLFNHYLSLRVKSGVWNSAINGDCFNLDGSNALFGPEEFIDVSLSKRIAQQDIHPVGPLFGEGKSRLILSALDLQAQVAEAYPVLVEGLNKARVKIAYRPLRVVPKSLNWQFEKNTCELRFSLPAGSYATALINQLVNIE